MYVAVCGAALGSGAHLIQWLGYKVVRDGEVSYGAEPIAIEFELCGRPYRAEHRTTCLRQASASYVTSAEALMQVVDEIGANRVRAVICY